MDFVERLYKYIPINLNNRIFKNNFKWCVVTPRFSGDSEYYYKKKFLSVLVVKGFTIQKAKILTTEGFKEEVKFMQHYLQASNIRSMDHRSMRFRMT